MKLARSRKSTVLAILSGAILLGATACSSDNTEASEGSGQSGEPLVIATSGTYNPITFSDGGELSGYDIDWGNAIGEKLDRPVEFVEGQLAGLLTGMQSGQYDLVMSALTITEERERSVAFSEPYLADGVVAVVPEGSDVTDITDIEGLTVGVIGGSGYQATLEELGGYAELVEYQDAPTGFADLNNGRIDLFAAGRIPAATFVNGGSPGSDTVTIAGEPYELLPAAVGVAKGETELLEQVNEAIAEIKSEGTGDEFANRWFGFTIPGYTD